MEKNKKKVLIMIGIILFVIVLLTIILSLFVKNKDNKKGQEENKPSNLTIRTEITRLTQEDLYFGLENIVNEFYITLSNKDENKLYNMLTDEYKNEKNITPSNILNHLKVDFGSNNFIPTNIYYNPNSSITYYFVNGYLTSNAVSEEDYRYYPNKNFIIIVKNNHYLISPLEDNINIANIANSTLIKDMDIPSTNTFNTIQMSEKNKLSIYINEFLNLLFLDTSRSYTLLTENMKKTYISEKELEKEIDNIYKSLSTNIFSYNKTEVNNKVVYSIKDDKQNTITIEEQGVMSYKIGFVLNNA